MSFVNLDHLNKWVDKTEESDDVIFPKQANLMNAALNRPSTFSDGDILPPAWHWLYFHETVPRTGLGIEGHPKLGGFMPPVPLPRRMWAGGSFEFERPITIGLPAVKRSTVRSIIPKEGRSGRLCFVNVEHEVWQNAARCLTEQQTIVYRQAADRSAPAIAPADAPTESDVSDTIQPDHILLFRYSALTFNSHRIHYDADFCRQHEGYPDLVVHGPLTATLLLDLFYHRFPSQKLISFNYRGRSPLFLPNQFSVHARQDGQAWAANHEGGLAMSAEATLAAL